MSENKQRKGKINLEEADKQSAIKAANSVFGGSDNDLAKRLLGLEKKTEQSTWTNEDILRAIPDLVKEYIKTLRENHNSTGNEGCAKRGGFKNLNHLIDEHASVQPKVFR